MRVLGVVFLMSFFATSLAFAKTASECHKELRASCKDKRGKERFACMKDGAKNLDSECQKHIEDAKFKMLGGADHPCKVDSDKCVDDGSGHEKVLKCLLNRRAELSDSCKKHVEERVAKIPCFEDRMKHCPDVTPGEGRLYECLKSHESSLSATCKAKLSKSKQADFDSAE